LINLICKVDIYYLGMRWKKRTSCVNVKHWKYIAVTSYGFGGLFLRPEFVFILIIVLGETALHGKYKCYNSLVQMGEGKGFVSVPVTHCQVCQPSVFI